VGVIKSNVHHGESPTIRARSGSSRSTTGDLLTDLLHVDVRNGVGELRDFRLVEAGQVGQRAIRMQVSELGKGLLRGQSRGGVLLSLEGVDSA